MSPTRIEERFVAVRSQGRAAFMPYVTLGYPSLASSPEVVEGLLEGGADLLELGIPFSDPLADGPVLQEAAQRALAEGTTPAKALDLVSRVRRLDPRVPILLLVYANTVSALGPARFAAGAVAAGADGLIVPDWPPDEAAPLLEALEDVGLAYVGLVSPLSSARRIARVAGASRGFLYAVSVTGVTGARVGLSEQLPPLVERIRRVSSLPVAAGFGIGRPEDACAAAAWCDGVIVGSALASALAEERGRTPGRTARDFARSFRRALAPGEEEPKAAGVAVAPLEPPGGRERV